MAKKVCALLRESAFESEKVSIFLHHDQPYFPLQNTHPSSFAIGTQKIPYS